MHRLLSLWFRVAALLALTPACASDNAPPALGLLADQQVIVGDTLRLVLTASDPNGDRVTFSATGLPEGAQITPRAATEAVLVWSPLITDTQPGGRRYEVRVEASDGRGGVARQDIGVVVYPTFGVPAFVLPAGVAVNLAQRDDIALLVEIKDDDSTEVAIEMTEGPDGAKLTKSDKKAAYFYWKPDDLQRTVAVHRAIFEARDESHAPVTHVLTLVLLNAEKQSGCDGAPPTIVHTPRPDTVLSGVGGQLELLADVTDAQSQVQSVTLHWTRADATDPNHPPTFAATSFTRTAPTSTSWRAQPDFGAIPAAGALVNYYIAATDNDDPTGIACDLTTRVPKVGTYTLALYPNGTPPTTCVDDPAEDDDSIATAPRAEPGHYASRRLCGPEEDYFKVNADPGTTITAGVSWDALQGEVSLTLVDESHAVLANGVLTEPGHLSLRYDQAGSAAVFLIVGTTLPGTRLSYSVDLAVDAAHCEDAADEPGPTSDTAKDLALGDTKDGTICPDDVDVFRVQAIAGKTYDYRLTFDQRYGDLDFELRAADGTSVLATAASERSLEELTYVATDTGPLYLRVYGTAASGAAGATGNTYKLLAAEAAAVCPPDSVSGNATPEHAAVLFQGTYEGFIACPDTPDWYAIDLNGGETLGLLALADGHVAYTLTLFEDPTGTALAEAASDADGYATIDYAVPHAGRYYYRVTAASDNVNYRILVDPEDPAGACAPDRLEPNSKEAPVPVAVGEITTWLRLCGNGDVDGFKVTVPAFATLTVIAAHATGHGASNLELYGPDGAKVTDADDFGDEAYLEQLLETPGDYTIVVRPSGVATDLPYDLVVYFD